MLIVINIWKETGIILRTHGKESNLLFLYNLKHPVYQLYCPLIYFAYIAETTKRRIKYSHKHFSDYLSNESSSTMFQQPTDKKEIVNIISSFNSSKVSGPNSISYRIYFFLKFQPLLQDWCFSFCTQNCKSNSCF